MNTIQTSSPNQFLMISANDLRNILGEMLKDILNTQKAEAEANDLLTTKEACKLLHVNDCTLVAWAKRGYLEPIKIGGKKYFRKSDITEKLQANND